MTAPTGDTIHAALTEGLETGDGPLTITWAADALTPTVQRLIAQAVTTALNDAHTEVGKARDDCPNTERRRAYGYALHVLRARAEATRPDATVADDDGEDCYGLTRSDYHGQMH